MIRLFVGLSLSEDARARLAGLRGGVPGARWIEPENLHLTLRFIGDVADDAAADIDEALARVRVPSFALGLAGVGSFGAPEKARILYAGAEPTPELARLQGAVESAVARAGMGAERRRFHPHITLARLKRAPAARVIGFMRDHDGFRVAPFPVLSFALFSSSLGRAGAAYRIEADYPLDSLA